MGVKSATRAVMWTLCIAVCIEHVTKHYPGVGVQFPLRPFMLALYALIDAAGH